ncbi:MAG: Tfx family DNA-binding protein [Methanosarcinales archaeon]|nr:Tfx family DNA-binding protein [Methanosarcinales archaeon]
MPFVESFLTKRQKWVLELRLKGYTQEKIADILKTSRANVSILEKRAYQNIKKAQNTLKEWDQLQAIVSIQIDENTDIMDIPAIIFDKADKAGIKVTENSLDVVTMIHKSIPDVIQHRRIERQITAYINREGEVSFD